MFKGLNPEVWLITSIRSWPKWLSAKSNQNENQALPKHVKQAFVIPCLCTVYLQRFIWQKKSFKTGKWPGGQCSASLSGVTRTVQVGVSKVADIWCGHGSHQTEYARNVYTLPAPQHPPSFLVNALRFKPVLCKSLIHLAGEEEPIWYLTSLWIVESFSDTTVSEMVHLHIFYVLSHSFYMC